LTATEEQDTAELEKLNADEAHARDALKILEGDGEQL